MAKKKKQNRGLAGLLFFSFLGLSALTGGIAGLWLISAPTSWKESVMYTVEPGTSVTRIAQELQNLGVLRSSYVLRALAMVRGEESSYQIGSYELPPGLNAFGIQDYLTSGRQVLTRITIPEGWTSSKIAAHLEATGITGGEGFLRALSSQELRDKFQVPGETLEGLLYPDTYLFPRGFSPVRAVDHMVSNFMSKLEARVPGFRTLWPGDEWYRRVILASVVEREYRVTEEAPLIASVFLNRIENRIPLGSCATVEYIITEVQKKPHPKRIFFADTEIQNPYNTYINRGLPPGPISNPGVTALAAAFQAPETDYLYFVVKDPRLGTHVFSTNYRDHNQARDNYLSGFQSKF